MTAGSPFSTRRRALVARDARGSGPTYFGGLPLFERRLAIGLELLGRTEAVVRLPGRQQLHGVRAIDVQPLGLPVRPVFAAGLDALAPLEPHPPQIVEDRLLRLARRPLDVGVLDAQDERAALTAREQPVEQRRARVADVQLPGRTRRESKSHHVDSISHASQRHGVHGDRLARAHRVDAFVRLALHADLRRVARRARPRGCRASRRRAAPASAAAR